MKRVISPCPMEKPCQLMMEPGELVMASVAAFGCANPTCPATTCAPVGLASAPALNATWMLSARTAWALSFVFIAGSPR